MDNLTHSLTGLLLSRTGLGKLSPAGTSMILVGANLPDADAVVALWSGSLGYLEYHRHITHALIMAPVLGLLTALAFSRIKGWRLWPAWALATVGTASHILLDLLNNYGVRIWLPWSDRWVAADLFMVIDPWVLAVLLLCVLAPLLSRLVAGEIGGRPPASPGRGWALTGLLSVALWAGGRWVLHERAIETLQSRVYGRSESPVRIAAWPTPWNPFVWRGYVATELNWRLYNLNLRQTFDPEDGAVYAKPVDARAVMAAGQTPEAQAFLRFARFPVWRITPASEPEGGTTAEATDVRFGSPDDGKFQLRVVLDGAYQPVSARFTFGDPVKGMGISRE